MDFIAFILQILSNLVGFDGNLHINCLENEKELSKIRNVTTP